MQPGDHIAHQNLSAFIDHQLSRDEVRQVTTHLETCSTCSARLDELRFVVALLQGLPSLEPPRDFSIGLRLVVDPPNVVRLRRWYGAVRAAAATLAAAFVFLSAGALYLGSQATPSSGGPVSQPQLASAPAAAPVGSPAARAAVAAAPPAPVPSGPAAPAPKAPPAQGNSAAAANAAGAAAPPLGPAVESTRAQAVPSEEVADQVSAATSVRPLPTPAPTPAAAAPTPAPPRVAPLPVPGTSVDAAAPVWTAAAVAGLLAALGLVVTLLVRRRLRAATITPTE